MNAEFEDEGATEHLVPMVRPEDSSAEPVVVSVPAYLVDSWKAEGWAVKE